MSDSRETNVDAVVTAANAESLSSQALETYKPNDRGAMPDTSTEDAGHAPEQPSALSQLAEQINDAAPEYETQSLRLGRLILQTREHFSKGKSGRAEWQAWLRKNIHLKDSRIRDLVRIAKADDPRKTERLQKEANRARQQKHRSKSKAISLSRSDQQEHIVQHSGGAADPARAKLAGKIIDAVKAWTSVAPLEELDAAEQLLFKDDGFPEMPEFLVRNKARLRACAAEVDLKASIASSDEGAGDA